MIITNKSDLKLYQQAAKLSTKILKQLHQAIKPGILPIELDQLADKLCQQYGVSPAFRGTKNKQNKIYQYATCISINDTVVHGLPSKTRKIQPGDLVKLDFGINYQGLYTDHCFTLGIKPVSLTNLKLIKTCQQAVQAAIPKAITNHTVGDLGHTMQSLAQKNNFDVLKQYTGHGIGKTLHQPPTIPAHGQPKTGPVLQTGMVLCLEAQLVTGSDQVIVDSDGWTVKMKDQGMTAMFEYMVVVQAKQPIILTPTLNWPITV